MFLTADTDYFIDYRMNAGSGVFTLYNADRNVLGTLVKNIDTAAADTFDKLTQVGIMNYTQAGGEAEPWNIKAFGFYQPSVTGFSDATGNIELSSMDLSLNQLNRPIRGIR